MKNSSPSTRREFFQQLMYVTSAGAALYALNHSAWAKEELKLIDMSQSIRKDATNAQCVKAAAGLQYVEDLEKALKEKKTVKTVRDGAAGKKWQPNEQACNTCLFYDYDNKEKSKQLGGTKKSPKEVASCQLIPNCLVQGKGSCISWAPNA